MTVTPALWWSIRKSRSWCPEPLLLDHYRTPSRLTRRRVFLLVEKVLENERARLRRAAPRG